MYQNHYISNPTSHFPPLTNFCIIFIFFLLATIVSASVDPQYLACEPKTCGDGQNITFPFYIKDQQQPFCGYPGFELSCNYKGNPILSLPGSDNQYIIRHISYDNQSLRVSNAAIWDTNSSGGCDVVSSLQNLSLPIDRFELVGDKTEVFVLYNCNQSLSERLVSKKVDECSADDDGNGVVLAVDKDDPDLGLAREECNHTVVAPVEGHGDGGESTATMMMIRLRRGFLMKWTASNCSVCQRSGGKCGFDTSTYHFKCFCPDRPHAWHCSDPGEAAASLVQKFTPRDRKLPLKLGLGIGIAMLLVVVLSIYIIWYRKKGKYASRNFLSRYTSYDPSSKSDLEGGSVYLGVPIFSYCELAEATNNFNHEKELGDGGFGTVYHGKLRDGREVAVKRLYEHNYRRVEQFINEIEILTRLRHKNLVLLYGCTSRHSQGLLLVYEFIPNGTVADHLHDEKVKWMATTVAELAFLCLQQNKDMRPTMDVVLEELQRIKSGECKPENLKEEDDNDKEELKSMQQQPSPSPPHCEESALLKNIKSPPSPISVTENWVVSNNTTPNKRCGQCGLEKDTLMPLAFHFLFNSVDASLFFPL
ncbi:hypothetical protein JRO89_XS05G0256600 [Xanthoceras sorbifolium]|uniref:non-specific serine/threonine protein kinase n=1 Tax=Xanthoceras sorbifolium TaxID=99658 RepID=A0ABQ8I3B1_9ROSI|nr:hypothetical protein JRO89_XS05G0256600 [Xanthoceras sorbifolium]